MNPLEEQLSRWRGAGLLTPSQADSIREYEKLRGEEPAPAPAPPPPPPSNLPSPPPSNLPPPRGGRQGGGVAIDGRLLGGILAALALLAMVGAVFALATDVVVAPTHRWVTDFEDVIHAVAATLGLVGGLRMAGGSAAGRRPVLVSLGLNLAATVLFSTSHLLEATTLLPALVWSTLAALTWYASFPHAPVATRSQVG